MMKLNGKKSLALLMVMPVLLLIELGIGWLIFANVKETTAIEANVNKLDLYLLTNTKCISTSESAQRGYLLTGDLKFYETYVIAIMDWVKNEDYYHTLPEVVKHKEVDEIEHMSQQKINDMAPAIALYVRGYKDSAAAMVNAGYNSSLADSIRAKSNRLREQTALKVVDERNREYNLIYAFFVVIVVLILLSLILTWLTYVAFRDYTRNIETTVKSLEEANQTLSEYNYNSYHALKTPLRNISGFLQLLEKKYRAQFDEEAKDYIHFIIDGVKQLNHIIDDMRHKFLERDDADKEPD